MPHSSISSPFIAACLVFFIEEKWRLNWQMRLSRLLMWLYWLFQWSGRLYRLHFFNGADGASLCAFVIATDVIDVVPFLIRGLEVINTTRSISEIASFHLGNLSLRVLRGFTARCEGVTQFRSVSLSFLVVSVCAGAFGVWWEVFARRVVKAWRML